MLEKLCDRTIDDSSPGHDPIALDQSPDLVDLVVGINRHSNGLHDEGNISRQSQCDKWDSGDFCNFFYEAPKVVQNGGMAKKHQLARTIRVSSDLLDQIDDLAQRTTRQPAEIVRAALQMLLKGGHAAAERRLIAGLLEERQVAEAFEREARDAVARHLERESGPPSSAKAGKQGRAAG